MMPSYIVSIERANKRLHCIVIFNYNKYYVNHFRMANGHLQRRRRYNSKNYHRTKEGSAQVIGGELWLNGNKTGKSIASLSQNIWRNLTNKEIIKTESDFQFLMEPGRCVYLSLIAVGYSHLEANISTNQLCFISKST